MSWAVTTFLEALGAPPILRLENNRTYKELRVPVATILISLKRNGCLEQHRPQERSAHSPRPELRTARHGVHSAGEHEDVRMLPTPCGRKERQGDRR